MRKKDLLKRIEYRDEALEESQNERVRLRTDLWKARTALKELANRHGIDQAYTSSWDGFNSDKLIHDLNASAKDVEEYESAERRENRLAGIVEEDDNE